MIDVFSADDESLLHVFINVALACIQNSRLHAEATLLRLHFETVLESGLFPYPAIPAAGLSDKNSSSNRLAAPLILQQFHRQSLRLIAMATFDSRIVIVV